MTTQTLLTTAGVGSDLSRGILPGLERVAYIIEQSKALTTRGRPSNEALARAHNFVDKDPVFNSLLAHLNDADTCVGPTSQMANAFLENANKVICRVNKVLDQDQPPLPEALKIEVRRAFVAILYVNLTLGSRNAVEELFSGKFDKAVEMLKPELRSLTEENERYLACTERIFQYSDQVNDINFPNPLGARSLKESWDLIYSSPQTPDREDYSNELGVLRDDLFHIATTVDRLERYSKGERLSQKEIIELADATLQLPACAGLGHIAPAHLSRHLESEGIIPAETVDFLLAVKSLHDRGVSVPTTLIGSSVGVSIVIDAAAGQLTNSSSKIPEDVQISNYFELEQKILGDVVFLEAMAQLNPLALSDRTFRAEKRNIFRLYQQVVDSKVPVPSEEIIRLGIGLRDVGLLNDRSNRVIELGTTPEYPLAAWRFLENVIELGRKGVADAGKLVHAFNPNLEERIGLYAEAEVAVRLIQAGHEILHLRHTGPKSGHIDYDILAKINGVIYGIEVKSTILALQQKNVTANGRMENTQLHRLTKNSIIDQYEPAIICATTKDVNLVRPQLREMWKKVGDISGGKTPKFLFSNGEAYFL